MTIAACHLSPEGVVLGADSTTTMVDRQGNAQSYLDHAQKIFEVGSRHSSVGLVTWGIGQIGKQSHRTMAALLGKHHEKTPFTTMRALADKLAEMLWSEHTGTFPDEHKRAAELAPLVNAGTASEKEVAELSELARRLSGGYCLAGRTDDVGPCEAFEVSWHPWLAAPVVKQLEQEVPYMWGVPTIMLRLIYGFDETGVLKILQSGKWTGTPKELYDMVAGNAVMNPRHLPIREAIDWIHTIIHTTIRGIKFARYPHWCGGPVEVGVVTSDRPFRWVCHKPMDSAIITREGVYDEQPA